MHPDFKVIPEEGLPLQGALGWLSALGSRRAGGPFCSDRSDLLAPDGRLLPWSEVEGKKPIPGEELWPEIRSNPGESSLRGTFPGYFQKAWLEG